MTGKGRDYEHKLGDLVSKATDGELVPLGTGYNSVHSQALDLLIDDGEFVHVFELKRTSKDGKTLYWDEENGQKDDLYRLCKFCVEYPRPAYPYAGVRFNNRQLTLTKLYLNEYPDAEGVLDTAVQLSPTEAKHTYDNNLRFYPPCTDEWDTQNLDTLDPQHLLNTIGYQL